MAYEQQHNNTVATALQRQLGVRYFPYIMDDYKLYEQAAGSEADAMTASELVKQYIEESDEQATLLTEHDVFQLMYLRSEFGLAAKLIGLHAYELLSEKLGEHNELFSQAAEVATAVCDICEVFKDSIVETLEPEIMARWESFKEKNVTTCTHCHTPIFYNGELDDLCEKGCVVMYGNKEEHFCSPKHAAKFLTEETKIR